MKINAIIKITLLSLVVSNCLYANDTTTQKLSEVTVTANKFEENLQNVPQSISVIDQTIIQEKGITDITGIVKEIPNMSDFPDHGTVINFRGLNSSIFTSNNPVVIYIDGIPSTDRFAYDISLANVERVEVLRGPQGTLYGKDAIGAVINLVTKEPTNEHSGSFKAEYASHNSLLGTFNLNGPIIQNKLFYGLNAQVERTDGWITNSLKNDDKANEFQDEKYSAYLLFKPTDELSTKLTVSRYDEEKDWGKIHALSGSSNLNKFNREDAKNFSFDMPTYENIKTDSQALNINYDFGNINLSSITTHKKVDLDSSFDADFGNLASHKGLTQFNYTKTEEWTQELRLTNSSDDIKWVTGLYFDKGDREQGPYGYEYPFIHPTFGNLGNYVADAYSKSDSKTQAIFGQVVFPMTQKLDLTLGGRYQRIKKDIDLKTYSTTLGSAYMNPIFSFNAEKTWNTFLPKIALAYKLNDKLTPFISISKGYMPGGFNYFGLSGTKKDNSFDPQTSINYELGLKAIFDEISFTASIFRMDIKDIHIFRQEGNAFLTDNAKSAYSQGIEFDFNYFPSNELEISGAVGLIQSKYKKYDAGVINYDGEKIENTPSYTASLGVSYHHPSGIYGRLDTKAIGATSFFNSGNQKFERDGRKFLADIKLGYRINDFDIYTFVKNITNEEYITSYKNNGTVGIATFNDPRIFGIGVKYTF